jgi:energy-coupling factor transporter ATP-binding protein EcfA2
MSRPELPHFESLTLENFTVFSKAEFEFSPGFNVFIGENGAGKTHVLKVLNGFSGVTTGEDLERLRGTSFLSYKTRRLSKGASTDDYTRNVLFGGVNIGIKGFSGADGIVNGEALFGSIPNELNITFIPHDDFLSRTRGFLALSDLRDIPYERYYRELVAKLEIPEIRPEHARFTNLITELSTLIGGTIEFDDKEFYLQTELGRVDIDVVASGHRKIATLIRLIQTGFIQPGSILLWDEPENSLNPKLIRDIVQALVILMRAGVQVFLATHSYVVLKELDLQLSLDDPIRYFALEPTPEGTRVHRFDELSQVQPNAILEEYDSLFNRQIARSLPKPKAS